jgi:hypothetical protein
MNLRIRRKREKMFLVHICRFLSTLGFTEARSFLENVYSDGFIPFPFQSMYVDTGASVGIVTACYTVKVTADVVSLSRNRRPTIPLSYRYEYGE